jgi:hypothetical protein
LARALRPDGGGGGGGGGGGDDDDDDDDVGGDAATEASAVEQADFAPCVLYMDSLGATQHDADVVADNLRRCARCLMGAT